MMNKTQKALLTNAGYDIIEELNCISETKAENPKVCVFYDGFKFVMSICRCELNTPEEQENFEKEFAIKYTLVKALNAAGGVK